MMVSAAMDKLAPVNFYKFHDSHYQCPVMVLRETFFYYPWDTPHVVETTECDDEVIYQSTCVYELHNWWAA